MRESSRRTYLERARLPSQRSLRNSCTLPRCLQTVGVYACGATPCPTGGDGCEMLRVASAGCDVHARLQDPARTSLLQQFPFSLSQRCGGLVRRCAHISSILKSLSNLSEGTVLTVSTLASPPGCRRMGFEDKQLTSCTALTRSFGRRPRP